MTAHPDIAHDPWALDDYQRRAMQFLFREGDTPLETARRRDVRSALLGVFSAVSANNAIDLQGSLNGLWACYATLFNEQVEARIASSKTLPAHPNDFDVVAYQPPPEIS